MMNNSVFEKNLHLFERFNPHYGEKIRQALDPSFSFTKTKKGELNLEKKVEGLPTFYHCQEGALDELQIWSKKYVWMSDSTVYVYGIGLGYAYDVMLPWLKSHPDNVIIFLEDDLAVLNYFLQTEKAQTLLLDSQVFIKAFHRPQHENDWGLFRQDLEEVFWAFSARKYFPTISPLYEQIHAGFSQELYTQLRINLMSTADYFNEFFKWSLEEDFLNFYHNLMHVDQASFAQDFWKNFEGLPAIICGAGPSLNQDLPLLKELENKALIFAAGSALNVLSYEGIEAHFSARLDPTRTQKSRLLSHSAFETPFFYLNRFSYEGLELSHATPLLVKWKDIFEVGSWFEDQLGLTVPQDFETGVSSSNFALEIAYQLGAKPLLLLGMDLCYSDEQVYAKGAFTHPTDSIAEKKKLTPPQYQKIPFMNDQGKILHTRWDWVQEAGNYALFARKHPEVQLKNATQHGLPIPEIPHSDLKSLIDQGFKDSYDFLNMIHATIQQGYKNLTKQDLIRLLEEWDQSLRRCLSLSEKDMQNEAAFIYLKKILEAFEYSITFQKILLRVHPEIFNSELEKRLEDEIARRRHQCLETVIQKHRQYIQQVLAAEKEPALNQIYPSASIDLKATYQFEENYKIDDPDLGIYFEEPKDVALAQKKIFYPNGILKGLSYYKNGRLHGPSRFYSQEGRIIAESWFINDLRTGRTHQYFFDGSLSSLQIFNEGQREGRQLFYYPDHTLKSELNYSKGLLNGVVKLYHRNGALNRELHYQNGKLHGRERMWNSRKSLILECFFQEGKPQGFSRRWFNNGQMAYQVMFHDQPQDFDWWEWNEQGELISEFKHSPKHDLSKAIESLGDLKKQMDRLKSELS